MGAPHPSMPTVGVITPRIDARRQRPREFFDVELGTIVDVLSRAKYGDTTDMIDLWLRMVGSDDQISSTRETRISPVYATMPEVRPGKPRTDDAVRLADLCRVALDRIERLAETNAHLCDARFTGYQVCEIVWGLIDWHGTQAWIPVDVIPVHARRFRFSYRGELGFYDQGRAAIELQSMGVEHEILDDGVPGLVKLTAGKYLVHQPISISDYPGARGLVFPLARWWWAKLVAFRYWLLGAEYAANPRIVAQMTDIGTDEQFAELEAGAERMSAEGVAVLREGCEMRVTDAQASMSADVWNRLVGRCNAAISKIILGSTLNVEIDSAGGNRAAAESQSDETIQPRRKADSEQLWASWQRYVFRFIRHYNPHLFDESTPLPHAFDPAVTTVAEEPEVSTVDTSSAPAGTIEGVSITAEPEVADTAYTGIQIEKGTAIIEKVAAGLIPRASGVEQLVAFFQMDRVRAESLINSIPEDFVPTQSEITDPPEVVT